MSKRNSNKIIALATILLAKANKEDGLTVSQMVEETEMPKATIHRILSEPGFSKCVESKFPPQYYFDPVFQLPEPTEEKKGAVDQRKYQEGIHTTDIKEVFKVLYEVDERLAEPIKNSLLTFGKAYDNVTNFKKGEEKLDTDNPKKLREAIDIAQYKLETYYQFFEKYNVDFDDPTWWEKF